MARQRALMLGADASRTFSGEPVEIGDCAEWEVKLSGIPSSDQLFLTDEVEVEIMHRDGSTFKIPLRQSIKVSGKTIRASILKPIEGITHLSVRVMEV